MHWLINGLRSIWLTIVVVGEGLAAVAALIGAALGALTGSGGTFTSRLVGRLTSPAGQRTAFSALRAFAPNLTLKRQLVSAYPNTGTAIVSRFDDMHEVLDREEDFAVVYQPRMAVVTGGENFFLGMQNTPRYTRDVSNMRLVARREDVAETILPLVTREAENIVAACGGELDVPAQLTLPVPARMVAAYFGTPGPDEQTIIDWTTTLFWYLFIDLNADPDVGRRAEAAAAAARTYLDATIAQRKAQPSDADDVLNRVLALQAANMPGNADLDIRNNLIGLIIGAIPTLNKASIQALDLLLDKPEALRQAQAAAQADDDATLAAVVFEALRFNPINPVIFRRAVRDTVIARGTARARSIGKDTMVFAANLSAMFDRREVPAPAAFRPGRPAHHYILWGYGLHTCFGAQINQAVIPALLKPLLKRRGLARARGPGGRVDTGGTPFPQHLMVHFDD